jgi:hypothetical protein
MISALFYGKGGFDHVSLLVNKTLPGQPFRVRPGGEFVSGSFGEREQVRSACGGLR